MAVRILTEAKTPLHVSEIWNRIALAGFTTAAKDPLRSLVSVLVRHPDVRRTGPNTYTLKSIRAQPQDPLEGFASDQIRPLHDDITPHEGEAA